VVSLPINKAKPTPPKAGWVSLFKDKLISPSLASRPGDQPADQRQKLVVRLHSQTSRGVCPIVLASAIVDLCRRGCYGAGPMRLRLQSAFAHYTVFCKTNRIYDVVEPFTEDRLHFKGKHFVMAGKAAALRRATSWALTAASQNTDGLR
jgi:hypothetical protein